MSKRIRGRFSVKISLVAHDFPLYEILQLVRVRNHVLVVLDLLVGLHNTQVDSGQVDLPRVLLLSVTNKCEMRSQVLSSLLDAMLRAWLVMEQSKLESGFGLWLVHLRLFIAKVKDIH